MKRLAYLFAASASLLVLAGNAYAEPVGVPEIDASGAVIALGLTAGLVALIRGRKQSR